MHRFFRGTIVAETTRQEAEFLQQFEPDVFWQKHGKKILIGVAAIVLIGLAAVYRQRLAAEQEEAAAAELAQARDPAALQRLAQDYRGQPLGAQALLRLAEERLQAGQYQEASATFQQFINEFPRHPMLESAQLALAATQEAQGNLEAARNQYQQIVLTSPKGYTAIAARLGAARCAEALGLTKEAQQIYEELRPITQGSPWETEVYVRWTVLSRSSGSNVTNTSL